MNDDGAITVLHVATDNRRDAVTSLIPIGIIMMKPVKVLIMMTVTMAGAAAGFVALFVALVVVVELGVL